MNLYFISGLGADHRVFQKLQFPPEVVVRHIRWVKPIRNESLPDYAARLSDQIDRSTEFSIAGLSFGGIIAIEISKLVSPRHTIIISSVSTHNQIPWRYRFFSTVPLHNILPASVFKNPTRLTYWLFGVKTRQEKQLLKNILSDSSIPFLRWAIDQILKWRNAERTPGLYHIHGTADKILPVKNAQAEAVVKGAGHFMVYTHAESVSELIMRELK